MKRLITFSTCHRTSFDAALRAAWLFFFPSTFGELLPQVYPESTRKGDGSFINCTAILRSRVESRDRNENRSSLPEVLDPQRDLRYIVVPVGHKCFSRSRAPEVPK